MPVTQYEIKRDIEYVKRDDTPLLGDLYIPRGEGSYPAVLLIHGGSWSSGTRSYMSGVAKKLAKQGFVAFNISYRFAPEHRFPAQIEDCKDAVRWMRRNSALYKIDPNKIASWGYSAGAQLAVLLGTHTSDESTRVQAVVGGSGPYDLTRFPSDETTVKFLGDTREGNLEIYRQASPVFHVSSATPPMFLYHGTADTTVSPQHTDEMKKALDLAGVKNEVYLVKGFGHIILYLFSWGAEQSGVEFLRGTLG